MALFILTGIVSVYFLTLRNKTREGTLFTAFMLLMTAFATVSILEAGSIWSQRIYYVFGQTITISLAIYLFVQFAYRYPQAADEDNIRPGAGRESTVVLVISVLVLLALVVFVAGRFSDIRPYGLASTESELFDLSFALGQIWAVAVLLRRAAGFSRRDNPGRSRWRHLFRPRGRDARAALNMSRGWILGTALGVLNFFAGANVFGDSSTQRILQDYIPSAGVLVVIFILTIVYLNNTPEQTSFMAKLVGISLLTILLLMSLVANIMAFALSETAPTSGLSEKPRRIQLTPLGEDSYFASTLFTLFDSDLGS